MIVVADTSVIINLALVGQEELLSSLFHEVLRRQLRRTIEEVFSIHENAFRRLRPELS